MRAPIGPFLREHSPRESLIPVESTNRLYTTQTQGAIVSISQALSPAASGSALAHK
jgi:hypothetical protein